MSIIDYTNMYIHVKINVWKFNFNIGCIKTNVVENSYCIITVARLQKFQDENRFRE